MAQDAVKLSQAQRGNRALRPYRLEVGELGVTIGVAQMPAVVGPQAGDGVVRDRRPGGLKRVDDAANLGIGEADSSIVCAATWQPQLSARGATAGRGDVWSHSRVGSVCCRLRPEGGALRSPPLPSKACSRCLRKQAGSARRRPGLRRFQAVDAQLRISPELYHASCPHDYRRHLEKNATQMAPIPWRLTHGREVCRDVRVWGERDCAHIRVEIVILRRHNVR